MVTEARPYTMISEERLVASIDAIRYVIDRGIEGAIVECGVWRGGSILVMIRTLQELGIRDREIYLFDTFEGMTEPTDADTSRFGESASESWNESAGRGERIHHWFFRPDLFSFDDTRRVVLGSGYSSERVHFIKGRVEDTIPIDAPDRIALLRLDTDWYGSTKHELVHLYPRLVDGGVLMIDDYGHWEGCRRAVDEYFAENGSRPLLSRVDYTGRSAIKG